MVRSQLLQALCDKFPNLIRKDIEIVLKIIFEEITRALCRGQNIEIRGFGSYKIVNRKARMGINPSNQQTVTIPEKKAIKWKMSKTLFNRLNKNFTNQ